MKKFYRFLWVLSLVIFTTACDKEEITQRDYPRLTTLEVTEIEGKGVRFHAQIKYRGEFEILKYGFVWSTSEAPELNNSEKVIFAQNIEANEFFAEISTTLEEGVLYYVRSFIVTEDYTVYGKEVEFVSLGSNGPNVVSFSPLSASWGDTIKVSGNGFSFVAKNNIVRLGEVDARLVEATDSLLYIIVPPVENLNSVTLSVSIHGNISYAEKKFTYLIPSLNKIYPLTGIFNDTITINGSDFCSLEKYNFVQFDGNEAEIVSVSKTHIKVLVPPKLNVKEGLIRVVSGGDTLSFKDQFQLLPPLITSFDKDTVYRQNEVFIIYGENFNPMGENNIISIEGHRAMIIQASVNHLMVVLPHKVITYKNISEFKDVPVKITVAGQSNVAPKNLTVFWHSTWTRKKDFPGSGRHKAVAFSIDDKGYFGTGISEDRFNVLNDFWEYDPETDQWSRINDFPGMARAEAVAFSAEGKGFVGLGSENVYVDNVENDKYHFKDFYSFDGTTKSWSRVSDFQGHARYSAACFVINNEAYVGTGYLGRNAQGIATVANDFWKYNPSTDEWSEEISFPSPTKKAVGFSVGNKGYFYDYDQLYRWEPDQWVKLKAPELDSEENIAFSIKDWACFGLGKTSGNALWVYDPLTKASVNLQINYSYGRQGASVMVIDNKAYIIGGVRYEDNSIKYLNDVWEFDPSKPSL
jgi:N-acetylneuraminic acid mutarotase